MEVLSGIILLIVMYIVIPIAILGATIAWLGGGEHFVPPALRRSRRSAETRADGAH
jgi:hypothetical protein